MIAMINDVDYRSYRQDHHHITTLLPGMLQLLPQGQVKWKLTVGLFFDTPPPLAEMVMNIVSVVLVVVEVAADDDDGLVLFRLRGNGLRTQGLVDSIISKADIAVDDDDIVDDNDVLFLYSCRV